MSYVYPDSPAAKAGVEPGWILLRLQIEGQPKPLEVQAEETAGMAFPWQRLDRVPEEEFDRIPTPWPSAESRMARTLTDLGFGKKFKAEFFHDGKVISRTSRLSRARRTTTRRRAIKSAPWASPSAT